MDQKTQEAVDEREEKRKEFRVRRLAKREGFRIEKLRGPISGDNCGRYMLLNERGIPCLGFRWDAWLDEIEAYLKDE